MIPTPQQVLPLVEPAVPALIEALHVGIEWADLLQGDPLDRDSAFWSHSARFAARKKLLAPSTEKNGWQISPGAGNTAIHLTFEGVHSARVLRSLNGTTPHAGHNAARQMAWHFPEMLQLGAAVRQPFTLIFDWNRNGPDLVLSAGLPRGAGSYPQGAQLHWRVPVTGNADEDLSGLVWDGTDPQGGASVITIDPGEFGEFGGERL